MFDITRRAGPLCAKCSHPTVWHSVQDVHTRDGDHLIQIFECENCERLTAISDSPAAARD